MQFTLGREEETTGGRDEIRDLQRKLNISQEKE